MSISSETEPTSYQATLRDTRWAKAMGNEIDALNNIHTWEFVDIPTDVSPIGSKRVYKIKRHVDGSTEGLKARLVAQGFNQTQGLDYFEFLSPVSKISTIGVLLALAAIHGWHLHEAFYMKAPQ